MRVAEAAGELDAVVHRRVAERDERDDVDRADARVLALVASMSMSSIARRDQRLEAVADRVVLAGQREHRPVVARVARPVEQEHAVGRGDGRRPADRRPRAGGPRRRSGPTRRARADASAAPEKSAGAIEHRDADAALAGDLDRPLVAGVDVAQDAHRRVRRQDALDSFWAASGVPSATTTMPACCE